jgi:hypothetical protein
MNKITNNNNKSMIYNKSDLCIKPANTLIIVDWDDTLYPTSWISVNNIDLTNLVSRYRYIKHFEVLDKILSSTLKMMMMFGEVIIISNAMTDWINLSVSVLPRTRKYLSKIEIISARERQQNKSDMNDWKKYTFIEEIAKRLKNKKYYNILSLGDAEFEYHALINLFNNKLIPHKYLKSIKFLKSNEFGVLLEQLETVKNNIPKLCKMTRQLDMVFDIK